MREHSVTLFLKLTYEKDYCNFVDFLDNNQTIDLSNLVSTTFNTAQYFKLNRLVEVFCLFFIIIKDKF